MSALTRPLFTSFALFLFASCLSFGQISTGTISGSVEDPTGALIPNAQISVKQLSTGETRSGTTGANGEFNVPFLQPGQYSLTASAGGFKSKTLNDMTIQVHQKMNLRIALDVGSSTETVEVTGAAPLVDSATSSLGQV